MATRKTRLVDCNPKWGSRYGEHDEAFVTFDCPEGHSDCHHTIPFTPTLAGRVNEQAGAMWDRTGDTFEMLTLTPSIRRIQRHANRAAALKAGCLPEYITESMFCALHIFIKNGQIQFCGDSH